MLLTFSLAIFRRDGQDASHVRGRKKGAFPVWASRPSPPTVSGERQHPWLEPGLDKHFACFFEKIIFRDEIEMRSWSDQQCVGKSTTFRLRLRSMLSFFHLHRTSHTMHTSDTRTHRTEQAYVSRPSSLVRNLPDATIA